MLLLTAFEPFDGTGVNSSLEVLRECLRRHGESLPLASATLPVEYDVDFETAWRAVEDVQPQAILHLGQTSGKVVAVERIGINLKIAQSRHVHILDDAPPAYFATIPVDDVVAAMTAAGVPAEGSAHAGTYTCNHVLFRSLHHAAMRGLNVRIGFIHLPRLPMQAEKLGRDVPTLTLETMVRGLEAAVSHLLSANLRE